MKGEKGITIVVPHVRRKKADDGEDEEETRRVTGFGTGHVFDVSQTDGEPLPAVEVPVLDGEEGGELYDRLTGLAAAEGLSLERRAAEAMPGEVMGYYAPAEKAIVVREAAPLQIWGTGRAASQCGSKAAQRWFTQRTGRTTRGRRPGSAPRSCYRARRQQALLSEGSLRSSLDLPTAS